MRCARSIRRAVVGGILNARASNGIDSTKPPSPDDGRSSPSSGTSQRPAGTSHTQFLPETTLSQNSGALRAPGNTAPTPMTATSRPGSTACVRESPVPPGDDVFPMRFRPCPTSKLMHHMEIRPPEDRFCRPQAPAGARRAAAAKNLRRTVTTNGIPTHRTGQVQSRTSPIRV